MHDQLNDSRPFLTREGNLSTLTIALMFDPEKVRVDEKQLDGGGVRFDVYEVEQDEFMFTMAVWECSYRVMLNDGAVVNYGSTHTEVIEFLQNNCIIRNELLNLLGKNDRV